MLEPRRLEVPVASKANLRPEYSEDDLAGQRVLHIGKFYPPHPGGIETHLKTLCRGLARYLQVRALVCSNRFFGREMLDGPVRVSEAGCWLKPMGAPLAPRLVSAVRQAEEDLLHVHWPNPLAACAYLAAGRNRPLVITWHSDVVRQVRSSRAFEPLLQRFINCSSAVIVSSPLYSNDSSALSRCSAPVRIVPFGIDVDAAARCDETRVREIRERYGPKFILAVGRLVYYKGFEHLIRAMREVPDAQLVIVGSGPLRETLDQEACAAQVRQRVCFVGPVADVSPYYHACDLFVLPSVARSEAFGIVQLEAMAAGKPVINTALRSGVPYVSLHGTTGITVPPGDSAVLANAINRLLNEPRLAVQYGHAGRQRVRKEFSLEAMVGRTVDVYKEVLWTRGRVDAAPNEVRPSLAAEHCFENSFEELR